VPPCEAFQIKDLQKFELLLQQQSAHALLLEQQESRPDVSLYLL